jgi:hypothetical protein
VLPTQETIDCLAERIERAFGLRCSTWYRGCSTPRVWDAAALVLWEANCRDRELPLDPELFVASQPVNRSFADPWASLAHPLAGERYARRVRRIIRQLRSELKQEVVRAEELMQHGHGLGRFLKTRSARFSPLGLYITAFRAGRPDLADQLRQGVIQQHNCCPLYRSACRSLLPAKHYPIDDLQQTDALQTYSAKPVKFALLN